MVKKSLIENFSRYIFLTVSKKYDKIADIQISQVFGTLCHVHSRRVLLYEAFQTLV